jgi:predicted nucleic acid-binding protein
MRIYLDNCCFNRPFDDQVQIRVRLESEAKLKIQEEIRSGHLQLAWSYIVDYENNRNPYQERRERIKNWKKYAESDIQETPELLEKASLLNRKGLSKIDCLHIACAILSGCEYFLTTDDGILLRGKTIANIKIDDPIGFIKEVLS